MNSDPISRLNVFLTQRRLTMSDVKQESAKNSTNKPWQCTFSLELNGQLYTATDSATSKKDARRACAAALLTQLQGVQPAVSTAAAATTPASGTAAGKSKARTAAPAPAPAPTHHQTLIDYCKSLGGSLQQCLTTRVYRGQGAGLPQFKAKGAFTHPSTRRVFSQSAIRSSKAAARQAMESALLREVLFETAGAPALDETIGDSPEGVPAQASGGTAPQASAGAGSGSSSAAQEPDVAALPTYVHGRQVLETADVDEVAAWLHPIVEALQGAGTAPEGGVEPVATVGFDTEWHGFKGVGSPTVILQLATADSVLIVHTLHMSQQLQATAYMSTHAGASGGTKLHSPLGQALPGLLVLLTDPRVLKVGRSMNNDAAGLIALFRGDLPQSFKCNAKHGYVDATEGTKFKVSTGAPELVATVLARYYKKQVTSWRAKWRYPLSPKELEYVADDACIPFDVRAAVLAQGAPASD